MNDATAEKLEVFLLLALRRETLLNLPENAADKAEKEAENDAGDTAENAAENDSADDVFSPLAAQLSAAEAEKFERLRADYGRKSDGEKANWETRVENSVRAGGTFLDRNIHRSHIEAALLKETAPVEAIISAELPAEYGNRAARKPGNANIEKARRADDALGKTIREAFGAQFVSRRDLPAPTVFDDLSGAQTARLIRLAGVREVALACVRIDAVESVASFLRRFSAEDARAIAAQLSGLPPTSDERLLFAENLVQTALESGLKPSAMLDLLGFRLVGIALCAASPERVRYAEQKLPLEVVPKLSETIDEQCRKTPVAMQREIERQIESLAEIAARASEKTGAQV